MKHQQQIGTGIGSLSPELRLLEYIRIFLAGLAERWKGTAPNAPALATSEPKPGYRILKRGEKRLDTDEVSTRRGWMSCKGIAGIVMEQDTVRRKVVPCPGAPGYRLLDEGESLQLGDEVLDGELWFSTSLRGARVWPLDVGQFRRPHLDAGPKEAGANPRQDTAVKSPPQH